MDHSQKRKTSLWWKSFSSCSVHVELSEFKPTDNSTGNHLCMNPSLFFCTVSMVCLFSLFFFSFWKVPCTFWVSTPVMILSELSWYLRLWCRMLIGWKEVALELSYMQHDISHGSFKWLDWQCQLCQAAMYKYKKTLAPYASEMFQAALLWSALSTQEVAFAVENKANKINWYQEISQVTAVELKYARWIMNLNNNVF